MEVSRRLSRNLTIKQEMVLIKSTTRKHIFWESGQKAQFKTDDQTKNDINNNAKKLRREMLKVLD